MKTFQVGIKGVVRVNNACLVLKATSPDGREYWDIPGGRIDSDETILETLTRELKEELPGIGAFIFGEAIEAYRLPRDISNDLGLVLIFYAVHAQPFEMHISNEHQDYRWVTKETLPELLTSTVSIELGYYTALEKALA